MSSPAIVCRDLQKTYRGKPPVEALRGIDLDVAEGECLGVLGPNGAGKTTAVEIMEGLLEPTSGDVQVLGMSWDRDAAAIRQRIGGSLQETQFSDKLTVLETLILFRSFYRDGMSPEHAMQRVTLQEKRDAYVKTLSGGQKQRLAVAVALVGEPKLLFLDEPTTGLDPQSRRDLWKIIAEFPNNGRTVLLTTHYMEEAERLCDRVAIIDHGKIIALGTPRELIASVGGQHVVEFTLQSEPSEQSRPFHDVAGVTDVANDNGSYVLTITEPHIAVPALLTRIQQLDAKLASLTTRHASLEDVFVRLTGRHLDDEQEAISEPAA